MTDKLITDGAPTAVVVSVTSVPRTRLARVACPYCTGEHVHGWPHGAERIGTRVAHCGGGVYRVEAGRG